MILCSGCSFTIGSHKDVNNNDVDYKHWPNFIPNSKNVAIGGAGNRLIARRVLDNIDSSTEAVVIMWSTIERYDWYMPEYNAYKSEGASYTGPKENYLKYFYTDFNQFAKTLEYILLIQNTCKVNNIPVLFSHMGDMVYADWDMNKRDNSFFEKLKTNDEKHYIEQLWNQVNWNNWMFHEEKSGLWQFTDDYNYEWIADHPGEQAHKDWAELVVNPRLKQLNISI
jgi:hypothetical protein|tara:strand:+ start:2738 stop:3412 length:675 start_codon:yes stop_codon:yes gene_type:complete